MLLLIPVDAFAGQITLAWDPSPDMVTGYVVYYGTSSGVHTTGSVDVGSQTAATIPGLTNGVRYYFVVKAYSASGGSSSPSNEVSGVSAPLLFTDDPLVPGLHTMRALHMTELRSRIDALRAAHSLEGMSWTPLAAGSTMMAASHITQLRTALDAIYQARGLPVPSYTDNPLTVGTSIKATHITQLRTFVAALE
jgi:hypothetical protein